MLDRLRREALIEEIAALESQRSLLGDRIVDLALSSLNDELTSLTPVHHRTEGERKFATIMFADASGFTAMSENADPETIRDLLNRCFERLVPIVERYGGTIDKFIGDAIMALFGAPVVHENDPERALRAALEMMQELDAFNRERGVTLGIHFGINSGEVIAGEIGAHGRRDYSVIGDPVNVAARLQDLSKRGEIFVGPETWRLTREIFDFETLAPVAVRGRDVPVPIYKLLRIKAGQAKAGQAKVGQTLPEMVGRDAELAQMLHHCDSLALGRSNLAILSAPAGVGKSRLIAELRARIDRTAFYWLEGRADVFSTSASYGVALDILLKILGLGVDTDGATIRAELRSRCIALLGVNGEAAYAHLATLFGFAPDDDVLRHVESVAGDTLKRRIAEAFDEFVHAAAEGRRFILCLEDVHWIDEASLDLLDQLARPDAPHAALIILTTRPAGEGGERLDFLDGRVSDRLSLQPLDRTASAALVQNFVGLGRLPQSSWDIVLDRADGNPFYLEELLRALIEAGAISLDPAMAQVVRPVDLTQIPTTLQGIVMARLDRLPGECKRTLQTASVLGRVFQLRLLAKLAEVGPSVDVTELERQLGILEMRDFLDGLKHHADRAEFEYVFKHAVTQEIAYNSLLVSTRIELHRHSAEAIELLFPDRLDELASTLAMHFKRAESPLRAAYYFLRAARRASAIYTFSEARGLFNEVLALLPTLAAPDPAAAIDSFVEAQLGLGDIRKIEADYRGAEAAYLAAHERATRPEARGAAHRKLGLIKMAQRMSGEALNCYAAAAAELGPSSTDWTKPIWNEWMEIELERLWAHYWLGDTNGMRRVIERSGAEIRENGTYDQQSRLFKREILILFREEHLNISEATQALGRESLEFARKWTNADDMVRGHFMVATCSMWRRELDDAEFHFLESLRLAEHTGNTEYKVMAMSYITLIHRMRGECDKVNDWAARTLEEAQLGGMGLYIGLAKGNQAWLAGRAGDWTKATALAEPVLDAWRATPFQVLWIAAGPALAAAIAEKRWRDAAEALDALLLANQQVPSSSLATKMYEAREALASGDIEHADEVLRSARPEAQALGVI